MHITGETLETKATAQLQGEAGRGWKRRYVAGDLCGAVRSAALSAREHGRAVFVVLGNSYGRGAWHVSLERRDVTCMATNSGRRAFRVEPDARVYRLEVA